MSLGHNTVSPAGNQAEYPVALSGNNTAGHVPFGAEERATNNLTQQETANLAHSGHTHAPHTGVAGTTGAVGTGAPGTTGTHHSNSNATVTGIVGKIEHVVGSIVHSTSLKEKGIMKEQEAASLKAEAQEISHAEALEQEAINARQRAAGHGANADIGKAVPAAPAGVTGNSGAMPGVMPAGPNLGGHSLV